MAAFVGRTSEWVTRMREARVLDIAAALGVGADAPRTSNAQRRGLPCPVCNAEHRHTKTRDKRGAVGPRPDGKGWRCFQCDASGDALDYVAARLHGTQWKKLSVSAKADVRDWCMRFTGTSAPALASSSARSRPRAQPPARPAPQPTPEPERKYPPLDQVEELWRRGERVDEVPEVSAWLQSKRLDAQAIADRNLARALRTGAPVPRWAYYRDESDNRVRWTDGGYLLIVQMVDAHGSVRSVLARNVLGAEPKSRSAAGKRAGLVLACGLGREVLATGRRPEWWPADRPLRFVVCEGEKKWCMRVVTCDDADELAPIVIGVESGSWTDAIAARIPDGSSVAIATDPDDAGAQYATKIVRSLETRWRAKTIRLELRPELELVTSDNSSISVRVRPLCPSATTTP